MHHYTYYLKFNCGHKAFLSFSKEKTKGELKEIEKKEIFIRRNRATIQTDVLERISGLVNDLIEEQGDSEL